MVEGGLPNVLVALEAVDLMEENSVALWLSGHALFNELRIQVIDTAREELM